MKRRQNDCGDSWFQPKRKFLDKPPREIRVIDFAKSRAHEIQALSKAVSKMSGTKTISQRLPRHMRRRAMSHNVKRLPRQLREAMQNEMKKHPKINPNKRPSRKFRRRPKNLLEDYNRRQKKCCWLETHIWHAKRFHMVEKWGYKLPFSPCDKSARACYRAAAHHCLLQDTSYMCCLEVQGPEDKIVQSLKHLASPETGPTIAAKVYLSGRRCGQTVLFSYNQYPNKPIGHVSFMWRPQPQTNTTLQGRQLWIWCHPSCFERVIQEVEQSCKKEFGKLESIEKENDSEHISSVEECSEVLDSVSSLKNFTATIGDITIRSLKDTLVRFQLTGPLSQAVLAETLQPSKIDASQNNNDHKIDDVLWWEKYFSNDQAIKTFDEQTAAWSRLVGCQSPAEAPPSLVFGLTVRDPRVLLPQKRSKVEETRQDTHMKSQSTYMEELSSYLSDSPLWEEHVRREIKTTKMAEHELNKLRTEHLVPGTALELGRKESRIPVLLVQRPGCRQIIQAGKQKQCKSGYGSGWDLIVPAGFGMAFHLAMVFRGARVGGLKEASCVAAEVKELLFPDDFPDTEAGEAELKNQSEEIKKKYQSRPPAKRPNYVKLGIPTPFHCPWQQLVSHWASTSAESKKQEKAEAAEDKHFYVLRNKKGLRVLNSLFTSEISQKKFKIKNAPTDVPKIVNENKFAIVPVIITMLGRGVPLKFAHICIPTEDDLKSLQQDKTWAGPKENLHTDPEQLERKKEKDAKKKKKLKSVGKNPFHSKVDLPVVKSATNVHGSVVKSAMNIDVTSVVKSPMNIDDASVVKSPNNIDDASVVKSPMKIDDASVVKSPMKIDDASVVKSPMKIDDASVVKSPMKIDDASVVKSPMKIDDASVVKSPMKIDDASVVKSPMKIDDASVVKSPMKIDDASVVKTATNDNQSVLKAAADEAVVKTTASVDPSCLKVASNQLNQSVYRPIIGYVSQGDFALGQGQGAGKGFCSLEGIHQLRSMMVDNQDCIALVRNTTSLQYRFAYLSMISPQ